MHDGIPYGRNQGQRQGHSREVDRQSPTGLILYNSIIICPKVYLNLTDLRQDLYNKIGLDYRTFKGKYWLLLTSQFHLERLFTFQSKIL